jgi:hypothetical protein
MLRIAQCSKNIDDGPIKWLLLGKEKKSIEAHPSLIYRSMKILKRASLPYTN